ncbi:MAG: sugar phosphate nucleotidyltransferase [Oscillospiraceae bacterium]
MDFKHFFIAQTDTIIHAMKRIDTNAKGIVFVVDNTRLLATVTDGDIRRHLLKGLPATDPVSMVANFKPSYIYASKKSDAKAILTRKKIKCLPVLDEHHHVLSIIWNDDYECKMHTTLNVPVVIQAGGKGTRLYPYTQILPKALIPIGEIPISERIIHKFTEYGCTDFFMIVNHKKKMIASYFEEKTQPYSMKFIEETEFLGTGGGISLLKGKITDTFFFSNCDSIMIADYYDIYQFHKKNKNKITMVCSMKNISIPYGVVEIDREGGLLKMKEKPELSFLTNSGFYIIEPEVIDEIPKDTFIHITQIIQMQKDKGESIGVYPVSENSWLDMGQPEELNHMIKVLADE